MTEKMLAMIGVVILAICATTGMVLARDAATVAQIALSVAGCAGVLVTLWKLGGNSASTVKSEQQLAKLTEKTESIAIAVNGNLEARFIRIEKMIEDMALEARSERDRQRKHDGHKK